VGLMIHLDKMAKCTGGTFNKLDRNFVKVSKQKAKDKKRVAGVAEVREYASTLHSSQRLQAVSN